MADLTSYARCFASPLDGDSTAVVRKLAVGRLDGTRRWLIDKLEQSGEHALAQSLLCFTPGTGQAWRPEVGLSLLAHRSRSAALAALQLGAAYAGAGGAGRVEGRVDSAQWLYLDGWLLPVQGLCRLTAERDAVTVSSELGCTIYSRSANGTLLPAQLPPSPWRAYPSGGLAPRYITASGLVHTQEGFPWIATSASRRTAAHEGEPDERIERIHQAWRLILEKAPGFAAWIASTATGCLLLEPSGSHEAQSGSSYDHPGLLAIEPPSCPVFCGEILVHECSHQQLLVYTMVVPLVLPGSQETYYSPIKRADRTIDRVLSGAHAVGNIILYYKQLARTTGLDRQSAERFEEHRTWFSEHYRPALAQSSTLTPVGRELWQSLCNSVDSAACP